MGLQVDMAHRHIVVPAGKSQPGHIGTTQRLILSSIADTVHSPPAKVNIKHLDHVI